MLGSTTADALRLGASAVGSDINVGGVPFRVIGILQPKGIARRTTRSTSRSRRCATTSSAGHSLQSVSVSTEHADQIPLTKFRITELLRARHGIGQGDEADFTIIDQAQLLAAFGTITGFLSLLLAGIASISLLVGGIGIMNIMLVSVRERTREIGIRKAVGARGRDILAQFLVEALVLSLAGGLLGIVFGVAASALIGALAGWGLNISLTTILMAVGFSLVVGVIFGVWPARQAARLDPITALRYE